MDEERTTGVAVCVAIFGIFIITICCISYGSCIGIEINLFGFICFNITHAMCVFIGTLCLQLAYYIWKTMPNEGARDSE